MSSLEPRRGFLKLMGASLGLAGLPGCLRWPEEKLAPYAHRPENRTPGVPVSYATALDMCGVAQGLLVTSYDGRPIKIEGNPAHPLNQGAADAVAQASVLGLYDPDRSRGVILREAGARTVSSWDVFWQWARQNLAADGAGWCILSEASSSPSIEAMRARLPKAEWFEYEPVSDDNVREGARLAFGAPRRPVLELRGARVIVALDADLFGGADPMAVKHARDFASGRRLHDEKNAQMNRLYVAESVFSITGACADHRRALRATAIPALTAQLAAALGVEGVAGSESGVDKLLLDTLVADLKANAGASAVVAGPRQPPEVHALVAKINRVLGNEGKTVVYYADPAPQRPAHATAIASLVKKMRDGQVRKLLILGGNPVYNAPADLQFAEALRNVSGSIHLGLYEDETSQLCQWHLSRAHYLESWGDARTYDGTVTIVQPLIEPLFDGKSDLEVLAGLAGDKVVPDDGGQEIVRRSMKSLLGESFSEWTWKKALTDGVIEGTQWKPLANDTPLGAVAMKSPAAPGKEGYELVFFADASVFDGRLANNGWLQELPDPMTRLTWDNAALMSPGAAESLGVKRDELVSLEAGPQASLLAPAFLLPGMPDGVIGLALGYGRQAAGNVGDGVGRNAYSLRTSAALGWRSGVKVRPTGKTHALATVQDHHIIDEVGREAVQRRIPELIRAATLDAYRDDPSLGHKKHRLVSSFNEHKFDGQVAGNEAKNSPAHDLHKWGMAIDLTACTGCGACVVACQAENNIPIVGREQVLHGREMHWLRIDRYFRGSPAAPAAVHQPVLCLHCENAPCEQVCPVAATSHSREGINMMTYNRCVGTRYCANNCPYKVRRFNFFDYNRGNLTDHYTPNLIREPVSELVKMQKNPEVTVRMRGVMEKCALCVQRIQRARIAAKREGDRPIADGQIQTACQQSCPAQAIVFGDLNDANSRVSQLHRLMRTYGLLDAELNTKPRVQYLAQIRNPAAGLDAAPHSEKDEG